MDVRLTRKQIVVDGEPRLLLAGEVHYFRVERDGWERRLDLLAEAGATSVASYIPWVVHEQADGTIDVTGAARPELDLGAFIDLAAERGLTFFARPGPFTMGELRHEGVPTRLREQYPHLVPVGWDGVPAPTSTLDYLHPDFLAEARRWYAALGPVLGPRTPGPVVGVQLDNEIGMLAWVSNTPDLTDDVLTDLRGWLEDRGRLIAYPDDDWAQVVRRPRPEWSGFLRVDLAEFMRDRFSRYVDALRSYAEEAGFGGVPFYVNIHGTEAGSAMSFPIGISQLVRTYRGKPQLTSGSDHYLGTLSFRKAAELHLVHAFMDAVHDADQPVTSLEFEAGTGDYGDSLGDLTDPSAVVLKTGLLLSQGCRGFNWYLFAGGTNFPDARADDDGTHLFGITGERHGPAAPVTPEGTTGPAYAAAAASIRLAREWEREAAVWTEEHDDLAVGFVPDHWATEYSYRGHRVMPDLVDELTWARGAGPGQILPRMLLAAGFRYGAVDLQSDGAWPSVVVLGTGRVLARDVQERLVRWVSGGGRLFLQGDLPVLDGDGTACTVLADALGVTPGTPVTGGPHRFPSVVGAGRLAHLPELRSGRWTPLEATRGEVLARSATGGETCAVDVPLGSGRVLLLAHEGSPGVATYAGLLADLGAVPGLRREVDGPGLLSTTTVTPDGRRFLHLTNVEGYDLTVRLWLDGVPLYGGEAVAVPPRSVRIDRLP